MHKNTQHETPHEANTSEDSCLTSMTNQFHVVIFGSARIVRGDKTWKIIYDLAKRIALEGMDLVTGGGPGLMDAASEGHYAGDPTKAMSRSIGLQIKLPREQGSAHHLDIKQEFAQFSERLDGFIELANVVVVAPGGVGTTLELFYTWQLLQVHMIRDLPIILLGDMWGELIQWIHKWPLTHHLLDPHDLDYLHRVNHVEDALKIIKNTYREFQRSRREPARLS